MPSRRVLVTGGGGFIGSRVVAAFVAAGFDVTVVSRLTLPSRLDGTRERIRTVPIDLLRSSLEPLVEIEAETVVHLAWYAGLGYATDVEQNARWRDASERLFST